MKYRILFSLGKEDSLHIFTRLAARENMGVSSLPSENKIRYFTRNKKYSLFIHEKHNSYALKFVELP